jgi:anti-sigma factor (TIGR02949 family)
MNCREFGAQVDPYVDGELGVSETLAADAHAAECVGCRRLADRAHRLRQLLRRQPRETAPPEVRARIVAAIRRSSRMSLVRPWLVAPAVAAAMLLIVLFAGSRLWVPQAEVVARLVDKHIAYAQLEEPAEFASADQRAVRDWFLRHAGLRVTVPDYSSAGIRLVGARIADVEERRAAYVLYEKGHTLLSVFIAPVRGAGAALGGTRVAYRGHEYVTREHKGYHTVSWQDGAAVFGLVSMLDYEALLECADRLRAERAAQTRL